MQRPWARAPCHTPHPPVIESTRSPHMNGCPPDPRACPQLGVCVDAAPQYGAAGGGGLVRGRRVPQLLHHAGVTGVGWGGWGGWGEMDWCTGLECRRGLVGTHGVGEGGPRLVEACGWRRQQQQQQQSLGRGGARRCVAAQGWSGRRRAACARAAADVPAPAVVKSTHF